MNVPDDYVCAKCGATGCKLWRQYQTSRVRLLCATCAGVHESVDVSHMNSDGKIVTSLLDRFSEETQQEIKESLERGEPVKPVFLTDQIGWHIPAVPAPDGAYWGYTSVPNEGVKWWKDLPTFPGERDVQKN